MALPILDGNQSATTLSTILTGGAHIPAHTVVSLGTQAISDIGSAVSGISVSIAGTQSVTGSVSVLNFPASQSTTFGAVTGSISVLNFPSTQTVAGTVTANVPALNIDTGYPSSALFGVSGQDVNAVRAVIYSSANSDFGSDAGAPVDSSNPLPVSGTVAVNGTVTATSNLYAYAEDIFQKVGGYPIGAGSTARVSLEINGPAGVGLPTLSGIPAVPVAGTVTANVFGNLDHSSGSYAGNVVPVQIIRTDDDVAGIAGAPLIVAFDSSSGSTTVTVSSLPSGALTTRFGSVATANLAFITSAVTNASRKYLLAQNISAGTVTIGIGFSPTTTQGIQLTAGAGLTFDAFCPTGAVYWLGAVTGAAFTILEG